MRFGYDLSRPRSDVVTAIELGDLDRGYGAIDITGKDKRLYSLTCSLYVGKILVAIPNFTKGKLPLVQRMASHEPPRSGRFKRPQSSDMMLSKSRLRRFPDLLTLCAVRHWQNY